MLRRFSLAALLLAAACTEGSADVRAAVVARVDGEALTGRELLASVGKDRLAGTSPDARRAALDELIERRLLVRAAAARGLRVADEDVDRAWSRLQADYPGEQFAAMLEAEGIDAATLRQHLRDSVLVQRLLVEDVVARVAVTDDEVDAWLAAHPAGEGEPERVRAAQIVVKTETEARSIHAELLRGNSFEELAKAHSLSPDGQNGGDLGFFARGEMPPPFDEVCFSLPVGQISDVVSSSYGFHVFKVLERREARKPDPEARRSEAERRLRREKEAAAQRAFLARLRGAAQIEVDEAALSRLVGT